MQHLQRGCDCSYNTKEAASGFGPSPEPFVPCDLGRKGFSSASAHSLSFPIGSEVEATPSLEPLLQGSHSSRGQMVLGGVGFSWVLDLSRALRGPRRGSEERLPFPKPRHTHECCFSDMSGEAVHVVPGVF